MKRIGNLYLRIIDPENLRLAERNARKGKERTHGVRVFDKDPEGNLKKLHDILVKKEYRTSKYDVFPLVADGGKTRIIYRLPYYPDRIVHHAIMNILKDIWTRIFTADTYSCIEGRGVHACLKKVKSDLLNDPEGTRYCLKLDVQKFYPSIDHAIMKQIVRKKLKCPDTLVLLDEIIDSAPGLPIGNYVSQYLGNLYLTYFDHWLKEEMKVRYMYRYCDDVVILAPDKALLHRLRCEIAAYLSGNLKLTLKPNYQVFAVQVRGIDFLGYRFFRKYTFMRKSIKKRMARKVAKLRKQGLDSAKLRLAMSSHMGWAKWCNSINLLKMLNLYSNEKVQ